MYPQTPIHSGFSTFASTGALWGRVVGFCLILLSFSATALLLLSVMRILSKMLFEAADGLCEPRRSESLQFSLV